MTQLERCCGKWLGLPRGQRYALVPYRYGKRQTKAQTRRVHPHYTITQSAKARAATVSFLCFLDRAAGTEKNVGSASNVLGESRNEQELISHFWYPIQQLTSLMFAGVVSTPTKIEGTGEGDDVLNVGNHSA